jgi:putative flippase GtrA
MLTPCSQAFLTQFAETQIYRRCERISLIVCSVGLVANIGIAAFVHDFRDGGAAASALIGILVGAVWNYVLSSKFVWERH